MKKLYFSLCVALIFWTNKSLGSEAGMPQLNPEFWAAQVFWLILIFSTLYLIIWKVFLPKIIYSIESRKSRVINDLDETEKLKKNAEKKLKEYEGIIEKSKKEAKKIIEDSRKKLEEDLSSKKKIYNSEIETEINKVEKEIKILKETSQSIINKISSEISAEVIKQIIDTEVNKSNASAIVDDLIKKNMVKHI